MQKMDRRKFLRSSGSASFLALGAGVLSGCTQSLTSQTSSASSRSGMKKFAVILPRSGQLALLGESMMNAMQLAMPDADTNSVMSVFDAGETDTSAQEAAKKAIDGGASVIFGPLRSSQTLAVLEVSKRVPIVTFSNDESLSVEGAYVMGLTASQSVLTMFTYARAQGLSRVAVLAAPTPFGESSAAAAIGIAQAGNLDLVATILREPSAPGLLDDLRQQAGGQLPDAVYIPDAGERLYSFAGALSGSGIQILGSAQWGASDLMGRAELIGATFAAPSPNVFEPFAAEFQTQFGEIPGVVAGLAFDAVLIGKGLIDAGELSARGLERDGGFSGVLGPFRFDRSKRCFRDLAVLSVESSQIATVAEVARV